MLAIPAPIPTTARLLRWSLCIILAATASACTPQGEQASPSPSVEAEPVFLNEEVLCEAVSHELLKDKLSFQVEDYNYKHIHETDKNGNSANSFNCNLYGQQSPPDERYGILIGYAPEGKLRAGIHNEPFSALDDDGLEPVTFEGIEGRGYVWSWNDNTRFLPVQAPTVTVPTILANTTTTRQAPGRLWGSISHQGWRRPGCQAGSRWPVTRPIPRPSWWPSRYPRGCQGPWPGLAVQQSLGSPDSSRSWQ